MSKTSLSCALLASLLALGSPILASAQDLDDPYLAVGLMLGLGGETQIETAGISGAGGEVMFEPQDEPEADAEVGIGGGAQFIYPVLRYFAFGAKFALLTWRSDSNRDGGRNLAFDLAVVPQLRLPLSAAAELYLSVPFGLTLDVLNEFDAQSTVSLPIGTAASRVESETGLGFNLAALAGARIALARGIGIFTELGYSWHTVAHDVQASIGAGALSGGVTIELDVSWWQIALNAGVYF